MSNQRASIELEPFDNLHNFRDVGKTINQFTRKRLVAEGLLFRSARPDDGTVADRRRLREEFEIKTIMDLRTKSEHSLQARKRQAGLQVPAVLQSNSALAEPAKIPGIDYLEININGKGFERSLLWKLSIWNLIKFFTLILFGYRVEAISILGRNVLQPRGLIGLGIDTVDHCGPEIAQALQKFSSSDCYPMMCHCTQGKDRTGLLVALLLLILEVPLNAISHDYKLSKDGLLQERESRLVEIREIGLTEDFADTPEEWIPVLDEHLQENYGGIRGYLNAIGVSEETRSKIVITLQG